MYQLLSACQYSHTVVVSGLMAYDARAMRRSILVTMDNEAWPEIDFCLYMYDPDGKGKVTPKIQRRSLYDTSLPNSEVHALNAMREIVSELIRDGKETTNYARQIPQGREAWQKGEKGNGRIWQGKAPQRKQTRPQRHVQIPGSRNRILSSAKGKKAKGKIKS